MKVASEVLEDMDIDPSGCRLYITEEDANKVVVVDPQKRTVLDTWPITKGTTPVATAVDEAHHRVFVACRSSDLHGAIVVIDTETGKELRRFRSTAGLTTWFSMRRAGRIYAVCGVGEIYVYQQLGSR